MQLVAKSDASYAEHVDGKSHTGGCVGFESDYGCWFMWISTKLMRKVDETSLTFELSKFSGCVNESQFA